MWNHLTSAFGMQNMGRSLAAGEASVTRNVPSVELRLVSRDSMRTIRGHEVTLCRGHMPLPSLLEDMDAEP